MRNAAIVIEVRIGFPRAVVNADAAEDFRNAPVEGKEKVPVLLGRNQVDKAVAHREEVNLHAAGPLALVEPLRRLDHRGADAIEEPPTAIWLLHHVAKKVFATQTVGVVEDTLPVDESFDATLPRSHPVHLPQEIAKKGIRLEIGRPEPVNLVIGEMPVFTIWPRIFSVRDGDAIDARHKAGAVGAGQQVKRRVGTVNATNGAPRESPPEFLPHSQNGFASVRRIRVPALTEINPQSLPVPLRSETDLRAEEGLVTLSGATRRGRCRSNIAG